MALKVLLADDSAAIKRVVQLSLQDFGVTIKAVSSGQDVIDVARSFQPDLAFVDVLLPQKPGYDIAAEMKADPILKKIPIILLWSSFMDFDDKKFVASGADDRLEKPFEVSQIRNLVNKLVSRTASNPISKHLEFPHLHFDEPPASTSKAGPATATSAGPVAAQALPQNLGETGAWNMDSFDEIPKIEFQPEQPAPFVPPPQEMAPPPQPGGDNEWVRKDLGKFRVDLGDEALEETSTFKLPETMAVPAPSLLKTEDLINEDALPEPEEPEPFVMTAPAVAPMKATPKKKDAPPGHAHAQPAPEAAPAASPTAAQAPAPTSAIELPAPAAAAPQPPRPAMATQTPAPAGAAAFVMTPEIEKLIQKEAQAMIEKVIWKLVPEIATNLIKEEIERLLQDPPTSP
jgi:CheY-like chemotaxis protein